MDEAALNAAKDEAVNSDEIVEVEEAVEVEVEKEVEEEVVDEDFDDLLPEDNKKRSGLGRKLYGMQQKLDAQDEQNAKMLKILERNNQIFNHLSGGVEQDTGDNDYLTKGEFKKMVTKNNESKNKYHNDFVGAFHKLSKGMDDEEVEAIGNILLEKYNDPETGDGKLDGASSFQKARSHYRRINKKKIPLQGKTAGGVATKQKAEPTKNRLEKLDKDSEKYLQYVTNTRGADAAEKLRKNL